MYVDGRGKKNRTYTFCFGDRHSTIKLYPYITATNFYQSFMYTISKFLRVYFPTAHFATSVVVRIKGLEPSRRKHQILSLACLPISPYAHNMPFLQKGKKLITGGHFVYAFGDFDGARSRNLRRDRPMC